MTMRRQYNVRAVHAAWKTGMLFVLAAVSLFGCVYEQMFKIQRERTISLRAGELEKEVLTRALVGPNPGVDARALLAALLPLDRLFGADYEDGSLDHLLLSGLPASLIAAAKATAQPGTSNRLTRTLGSTDNPGPRVWPAGSGSSNRIFTGTR